MNKPIRMHRSGMLALCLIAVGMPLTSQAVDLQTGLNGAWYKPEFDGQGLIVHVIPDVNQIFAVWFTYSPEGDKQLWLTVSGSLDSNPISLTVLEPSGGAFDQALPAVTRPEWGSATLEFLTCTTATFSFQGPGSVAGQMDLQRLTPVLDCEEDGS